LDTAVDRDVRGIRIQRFMDAALLGFGVSSHCRVSTEALQELAAARIRRYSASPLQQIAVSQDGSVSKRQHLRESVLQDVEESIGMLFA
jgi:hypothetical protein